MALPDSDRRHLLGIDDLDQASIESLVDRTGELARGSSPSRLNLSVTNLFFEPSTRTRVSFELAARRVGAELVNIEAARSSTSKGESLSDTAATLSAMGIDVIVLRHPETGCPSQLADDLQVPATIINAGDGSGEHPSQALLDAATLNLAGLDWPNAVITVIGDLRHSRVARSGLKLFRRLGAGELRIAGPEGLLPETVDDPDIGVFESLDAALLDADAVMMLRVQHERMDQAAWPNRAEYARHWSLTAERLKLARPDCRVLHPGPINRGMEIDPAVADGPQSLILEQVRMGVCARMAIFEWIAESVGSTR